MSVCLVQSYNPALANPSGSHLLAQVPLTVSPFIKLPKAPTLPHNYASLPSTLPPSCTQSTSSEPAQYVTSRTGSFAAHPSQIVSQNRALLAQLTSVPESAQKQVQEWEEKIREREMAERRRRAPGWLDRDEKILEPEKHVEAGVERSSKAKVQEKDLLGDDEQTEDSGGAAVTERTGADLGAQMDRAFGGLG